MTSKRKKSYHQILEDSPKRAKLPRESFNFARMDEHQSTGGQSVAPLDPECGQRGAFPGLESNKGEDQLFYGPASDGLEYLRMVRSEAKQVPKLLVVPIKDRGPDSFRQGHESNQDGWYADGAYVAAPEDATTNFDSADRESDLDSDSDIDAQDAYYSALVRRFLSLRQALSTVPNGSDNLRQMENRQPRALYQHAKRAQWSYEFRCTSPRTRELMASSQDDIIRGISRLEELLTRPNLLNQGQHSRLSIWSWGLLAACRDIGQMSSEEVSILRILGKTALRASYRIRGATLVGRSPDDRDKYESDTDDYESSLLPRSGMPVDDVEEDGEIVAQDVDESSDGVLNKSTAEESKPTLESQCDVDELERMKKALLGKLESEGSQSMTGNTNEDTKGSEEETSKRALATLEIIVTIVGEVFGQRDLLDHREAWVYM